MKVDSNATVPNGISNDTANNNDIASPISAFTATTSFPDITTIDITTAVQPTNLSFASRLATEIIPDSAPKITSTTIQIPVKPDMSEQSTTASIMESEISTSDNTMTNTLANANVSNTSMLLNATTEIVTNEASTNAVTSDILSSTESTSDNFRSIKSVTKTMEVTSSSTMITDVSTPTSLNLQMSTISDVTFSPITESITITQISPETTTMSVMNDISENIETNTVQQYNETMPPTTGINDLVENIEINTIQQFNATIPPQITKTMNIIEYITTEKISNNITEIQITQTPVVTSTFRTRFIDIAQNMLLHLKSQSSFSTVRTSIQNPVVINTSPNTILNLSSINMTNSEEMTTVEPIENVEITTSQDVDTTQTTINRSVQTMSTQNVVVDVAAEFSIAHNRSNNQEIKARDMPSSNMTYNARNSSREIANNSQFADFVTKNNSQLFNDTLLTKLMTIAKTLFTEGINETQQLLPNQIYDIETTTVPDTNNWNQTDGMMENNDKNQFILSNDTSEITNASAKLSTVLKNISERIDVTTSGNEIEENSNRPPTIKSEISLMEFNTRPTDITNLIDVGDIITTLVFQTKIEISNIIIDQHEFLTNY